MLIRFTDAYMRHMGRWVNSWRPEQNSGYVVDHIFKCILFSVVSRRLSRFVWAHGRCSGSYGILLHTWLVMVNRWLMCAAGPYQRRGKHCHVLLPEHLGKYHTWKTVAKITDIISHRFVLLQILSANTDELLHWTQIKHVLEIKMLESFKTVSLGNLRQGWVSTQELKENICISMKKNTQKNWRLLQWARLSIKQFWFRNWLNKLRPIQNGHHFPDDIFKCIFLLKIYGFRWSFFLRFQSTKFQHWFR